MLEKDYTNILKKLENDLPPNFRRYSLEKHDIFGIIIDISGERTCFVCCFTARTGLAKSLAHRRDKNS